MSTRRRLPEPPFTDAPWGTCRWCGKGISKPDGTQNLRRRWHQACLDEFLDLDIGRVRLKVFDRDRGVCAACGVDTSALEAEMRREWQEQRKKQREEGDRWASYDLAFTDTGIQLRLEGYLIRQSLWQMDHVVPTTDGGEDVLDNLQTLCQPCHRVKTARENSARARRAQYGG